MLEALASRDSSSLGLGLRYATNSPKVGCVRQLTISHNSEVSSVSKRPIRGRTSVSGYGVSLGRVGTRLRMLERLRPEGGFIPLDLELLDVVAELDPGMIDWRANLAK
jgi:hypothetical protein